MVDTWLRIALIGGVLAGSLGVALLVRQRAKRSDRVIDAGGLAPGIYFFSSSTCETCVGARRDLSRLLGPDAFIEFAWEDTPGVFDELGIEAVPATLIVSDGGHAVLYPGAPARLPGVGGP